MRIAVIDLGTNTCNIVIADRFSDGTYTALSRGTIPVRLGKGGINNHSILPDAADRAVSAINKHLEECKKLGVEQVVAIATSAVRSANNRSDFEHIIKQETGISLTVISGEEEASYIFDGVRQAVDLSLGNQLILDIGGGSNELILAGPNGQLWKHSFNLGMARIVEKFSISNPISEDEQLSITSYFNENLEMLWEACAEYKPKWLIGCAGAFNTMADVLKGSRPKDRFYEYEEVSVSQFNAFHRTMVKSTYEERLNMPGMFPIRAEMMLPASLFINLIMSKLSLPKIIVTGYSLREGVVKEFNWDE